MNFQFFRPKRWKSLYIFRTVFFFSSKLGTHLGIFSWITFPRLSRKTNSNFDGKVLRAINFTSSWQRENGYCVSLVRELLCVCVYLGRWTNKMVSRCEIRCSGKPKNDENIGKTLIVNDWWSRNECEGNSVDGANDWGVGGHREEGVV